MSSIGVQITGTLERGAALRASKVGSDREALSGFGVCSTNRERAGLGKKNMLQASVIEKYVCMTL
jgi:hypothetical protein